MVRKWWRPQRDHNKSHHRRVGKLGQFQTKSKQRSLKTNSLDLGSMEPKQTALRQGWNMEIPNGQVRADLMEKKKILDLIYFKQSHGRSWWVIRKCTGWKWRRHGDNKMDNMVWMTTNQANLNVSQNNIGILNKRSTNEYLRMKETQTHDKIQDQARAWSRLIVALDPRNSGRIQIPILKDSTMNEERKRTTDWTR